jgi:ribonuclease HII
MMSRIELSSLNGIKPDTLKEILSQANHEEFVFIREALSNETRKTIISLLEKEQRRYERELIKIQEYHVRCKYENKLLTSGFTLIAGIDEVGRGPLAGPVYTCAVILDPNIQILGIKDSKKLNEKQRDELSYEIKEKCIAYSLGIATEGEIDEYNILNATKLAMKRAVEGLPIKPDFLLIDALELKALEIPQYPIIKGDDLSVSIGAASIVAKVARDTLMKEFALEYPEYGFEENKGYGTKLHIDAIKKYGLCKIHRRSFVKNFI